MHDCDEQASEREKEWLSVEAKVKVETGEREKETREKGIDRDTAIHLLAIQYAYTNNARERQVFTINPSS